MAKYTIAPGVAITSKGTIFSEGREVTKDDFPTEEIFNSLLKSKKIISSEGKAEEKKSEEKADEKKADSKETDKKKTEEKK
jgi:hypothetical protein